jgi:alkylhydroperoxidase/carboxymuconolactone decarboxylase family protein YurZ
MPQQKDDRQPALQGLADTVNEAAAFFVATEESLSDGYQSAREVLSHLVFWHREYVAIAQALADGCEPELRKGTYAELNAGATCEFEGKTMEELARLLLHYQKSLEEALLSLPDWGIIYPVKYGGRLKCVAERLPAIESHIRNHVKRLQRAERRGEGWVRAYFPHDA